MAIATLGVPNQTGISFMDKAPAQNSNKTAGQYAKHHQVI